MSELVSREEQDDLYKDLQERVSSITEESIRKLQNAHSLTGFLNRCNERDRIQKYLGDVCVLLRELKDYCKIGEI